MTNEKSWPSRFGTLGEKVFGKDDPFNDRPLSALGQFSSDDMPPTRSPIDGTYFTSKSKLRAQYKAHGAEEVGTAYDNGYDPGENRERSFKKLESNIITQFRERLKE